MPRFASQLNTRVLGAVLARRFCRPGPVAALQGEGGSGWPVPPQT